MVIVKNFIFKIKSMLLSMVSIDNVNYDYNSLSGTIYQFCYEKNVVLPCFCYHEKLSIAGNCRMCLVEANGALAVSCAVPVLDGMRIITKSQRLIHARESVVEFLLINHPLDCPICDQGGECDLQDISLSFGLDRGRFYETKRSVDNLNCCGPLIKTMMTRCIHCTRCVRFLNEYCDVFDLGVLGRGALMEIGSYIEKFTLDALSANIIDLCPVGALTSMPYAFTARPWELRTIESIDVLDALASSIRIDIVNNQVARVSPILMECINEDWLTNKARFCYDSLTIQRIYYPRIYYQGRQLVVSWIKALSFFMKALFSVNWNTVAAVTGSFLDLEAAWSLKNFFNSFGCNNIFYQHLNASSWALDYRFLYLLNITLQMLEESSFIILLSTNLRLESPLVNSRLRKNFVKNRGLKHKNLTVISFGQAVNYAGYPISNLGSSFKELSLFIQGKFYFFSNIFFNSFNFRSLSFFNIFLPFHLRPIILLGESSLSLRSDNQNLYKSALQLAGFLHEHSFLNKKIFNVITTHLGTLSLKETGVVSGNKCFNLALGANFTYLLGADYLPVTNAQSFLVYQGSHLPAMPIDQGLVLPTVTYVEHISTFINLEGRVRTTKIALAAPPLVLSDIEVIRLLNILKIKTAAHNLSFLENFYAITDFFKFIINYKCCFFGTLNKFLEEFVHASGFKLRAFSYVDPQFLKPYVNYLQQKQPYILTLSSQIFGKISTNYYAMDTLSRNSKIMGLCSARIVFSSFS